MCSCGLQMSSCDDLEVWDADIPANFDVWQILNTETECARKGPHNFQGGNGN